MVFSMFSYEAVLTSELDFSLFVTAGGPSVLTSDASFEIIAASWHPSCSPAELGPPGDSAITFRRPPGASVLRSLSLSDAVWNGEISALWSWERCHRRHASGRHLGQDHSEVDWPLESYSGKASPLIFSRTSLKVCLVGARMSLIRRVILSSTDILTYPYLHLLVPEW